VTTRTRSEARRILGIEENERVALTWGFDNAYKGTDLLAAGFSIYRKRDARARLILGVGPHPKLGSSQYGSDYNQRFEEIGRADGVNSVGFIPFDQLETYTVAADVVVFPYRKYLAASGPMAITLGLGRPILASNVFQDIPAILRFEPSPAGIADALEAFFADPTSVSEASLALAEARSPEHVTDLHVAAYLATVERNA
jgi:glycosyltransferase involved in cell wall biosynthesis